MEMMSPAHLAGVTAAELAVSRGHWLAEFLIDAWLRSHPERTGDHGGPAPHGTAGWR